MSTVVQTEKIISDLTIIKPDIFHIEIPFQEFLKMMFYVKNCDIEISGLGTVYERRNGAKSWLEVKKVYLLEQECTSHETVIDTGVVSKFLMDNERIAHRLKLWWHSHAKMSVFWSETDEKNIKVLRNNHYLLSIVGNHAFDVLGRVDSFSPMHNKRNGVPIFVDCSSVQSKKLKEFLYETFIKDDGVFVEDLLFNFDFLKESKELLGEEIKTKVKKKVYQQSHRSQGFSILNKETGEWESYPPQNQVVSTVSTVDPATYQIGNKTKKDIRNVIKKFFTKKDRSIFNALVDSKSGLYSVIAPQYNLDIVKSWATSASLTRPHYSSREDSIKFKSMTYNVFPPGQEFLRDLEIAWVESLPIFEEAQLFKHWMVDASHEVRWAELAPIVEIEKTTYSCTRIVVELLALVVRGELQFGIALDILYTTLCMTDLIDLVDVNTNLKLRDGVENLEVVVDDKPKRIHDMTDAEYREQEINEVMNQMNQIDALEELEFKPDDEIIDLDENNVLDLTGGVTVLEVVQELREAEIKAIGEKLNAK